jgi:hypothetical protein
MSACKYLNYDHVLLSSIIATESAGEQFATRYEPDYRWLYEVDSMAKIARTTSITEKIHQKTSWGLMQLMGALLRELGFRDPMPQACGINNNLKYGIMHLKNLEKRYEKESDVIAAYNAGSPRKTESGIYVNQAYVDKVYGYMDELSYR